MIRKAIACSLLVTSLAGCFGHGALTNRLLNYNLKAADSRLGRASLFVGLWIIPVYPISALADLLIFNSIEFWRGTNPLSDRRAVVDIPRSELDKLRLPDVELAQIERLSDVKALLHVAFKNGDRATFDVLRDGDQYTVSYGGVEFFRGNVRL